MSEKVPIAALKRSSVEDYLVSERQHTLRNEFMNGQVISRSGSNRWHNLIVSNAAVAIGSRLHGNKIDIYIGGMRVRMSANMVSYPDIVLVNGEPSFADQNLDLLQNPTVVVEIFSSKTNTSDKTKKMEAFLAMESIKECLMIKEDEMRIEHYARQNAKQWIYRIYNERDDVVSLESVNCKIALSEVYSQIKFAQAEISSRAVN